MPRGEFDRSEGKAQRRSSLLAAAARVYARRGFGGATLDEVAAEAGFTKGAVYSHFGSKENLLLALMEEHLASQVAEQIALFDRDTRTWERPLAGSARWMEQLEQDPDPVPPVRRASRRLAWLGLRLPGVEPPRVANGLLCTATDESPVRRYPEG
jgi:AcrR family transcriptional regulator